MGKYTDIAESIRKEAQTENTIDGHIVAEVVWQTDLAIVFRDENGKLWRRVHAWKMTWPMASQAEEEFRKILDLKDVAFLGAINIMCINLPGNFQNSTDWENYVAEAVESGYLSQSEAKQLTSKGKGGVT